MSHYTGLASLNVQTAPEILRGQRVEIETMREWHRSRIQALVEGGVDLLALETIPCQEDLLREFPNIKAWLAFTCKTMREWHRPRIQALVEGGVDLLALETIPCQEEAEMLCDLLREFPNIKAWLAFTCKDDQSIAHGESFQKVAKKCWESNPDQLVAVGVNCCAPSFGSSLLKGINDDRPHAPIPLVVYPNSGEKYNPQIGWIDRDKCEPVEVFIQEWLDLGVRYVGGCCRTYAADVSRIRNQVHCWRDRWRFQNKFQANAQTTMREWHRPRIQALVEGRVDLLVLEMMTKAHGESLQKVAKKCWESNPDQVVAVGVNCCAPSFVSSLLKGINDDDEKYNPEIGRIDCDKCEPVEVFIQGWQDLGVHYVGGCCRTYAADVSRIRNQVHCWRDCWRFQNKFQANAPTIN